MYTPLRAEIHQNIDRYQLRIKPLAINQYQRIEQKVFDLFCTPIELNTQPIWVWSFLKNIETHEDLDQIDRPQQLQRLIPHYCDQLEVFCFLNDSIHGRHKFWWYEGYILDFNRLLDAINWQEFYLVDKKYEWLICVSHHDVVTLSLKDGLPNAKLIAPFWIPGKWQTAWNHLNQPINEDQLRQYESILCLTCDDVVLDLSYYEQISGNQYILTVSIGAWSNDVFLERATFRRLHDAMISTQYWLNFIPQR
jgi:hypothetical protein